jgi:acid phosphatase family membrane protein YuiD
VPANEAIIVELKLAGAAAFQSQARGASKSIGGIGDAGKKAEKPTGKLSGAMGKLGPLAAGAAVGGGLMAAKFGTDAVKAFRESWKIGQQTGAVIKSTGGAANVTAGQVGNLASSISNKTGIDDETIQSGQNMLLTFTKVRNEAGKGNDIFNQSTKTLVDMSAALGSDPQKAAVQLGKALNDPVKGVSALSKVGVSFDDAQKKRIKGFVKEGKTASAQKLILRELNREFGGSAKAQATSADKLKVAYGNLQENVGKKLAPGLEKVSSLLLKLGPFFSKGGGGARFLAQAGRALQPVFRAAKQAFDQFLWAIRPILQNVRYLLPVLKVLGTVAGVLLWAMFKRLSLIFRVLGIAIRVIIAAIRIAVGVIRSLINAGASAYRTLSKLATTIRNALASAFRTAVSKARGLISGFKSLGKGIIDALIEGIKSAPGAILDAIKSLIPGGKIGSKIAGVLGIGSHATGGIIAPGERVSLVGERGPELATFRPGTRITPLSSAPLSRLAAGGAGSGRGDVTVPVYLNGREIARATAQDTADQRARRGW